MEIFENDSVLVLYQNFSVSFLYCPFPFLGFVNLKYFNLEKNWSSGSKLYKSRSIQLIYANGLKREET